MEGPPYIDLYLLFPLPPHFRPTFVWRCVDTPLCNGCHDAGPQDAFFPFLVGFGRVSGKRCLRRQDRDGRPWSIERHTHHAVESAGSKSVACWFGGGEVEAKTGGCDFPSSERVWYAFQRGLMLG